MRQLVFVGVFFVIVVRKKVKKNLKFFQKGIDKVKNLCYYVGVGREIVKKVFL